MKYTKEQLALKSFSELRDIGNSFKPRIKGRGRIEFITEIMEAQKEEPEKNNLIERGRKYSLNEVAMENALKSKDTKEAFEKQLDKIDKYMR